MDEFPNGTNAIVAVLAYTGAWPGCPAGLSADGAADRTAGPAPRGGGQAHGMRGSASGCQGSTLQHASEP